ncbi:DUF4124 domain-containing protein [Variovorax sp. RTB1]|jgi:hypothetical protein|nr:DUF4124 domain-containing protein [Variovorax sp. RTB1]
MSCAALLAAVSVGTVEAQVQRCTDANGKVSYSDAMCDGDRAVKVFSAGSTASQQWKPEGYRAPLPMVPPPNARPVQVRQIR